MKKKETLKAVLDSDLDVVLERLGLLRKFDEGELKCSFCGDAVTQDNLHAIYPDRGVVKVSCSRAECVEQLLLRLQELKSR